MTGGQISVFLADDNAIVREGVRAMLALEPDIEVVGVARDYDELVAHAGAAAPQVLVTDIRMPPTFQREGINAAKELRKRHPGTGVVVLSQYDDPEYAVSLLSEGAAGYAYLLKDAVAEGNQLASAVRQVASGGSMLDPKIVDALMRPVTADGELNANDEELLRMVAAGMPIKAIGVARRTTPAAAAADVEGLFLKISRDASAGTAGSLRRLRLLHQAIVDREEQGETLSRLLPGGLADKVRRDGASIGDVEELDVTVLMSDVRGYSAIAEKSDPSRLARQVNTHRAEMNHAVLDAGGTVMQFVGDAVMAVFGAPVPQDDHADRAVGAAVAMIQRQATVDERWAQEGLPAFGLGIGVSTGRVAAALLGSEERLEYTVVGDTVNLAQRLQDQARPAGRVVLSEATYAALRAPIDAQRLDPLRVKGRAAPVNAYVITVAGGPGGADRATPRVADGIVPGTGGTS
ncbi:MAG TPA: adenylate/guanylate cyclase domain-containing protein [Acidimicrobiales bacterium]|nr:adenylate/guanylate cyclase domain-containing protein [Acidimicrobiales bacterium]